MTNEKQPPKGGVKYGPGTATKGRISEKPPVDTDRVVGNRVPPYDVTGTDALSPLLEHVDFPATKDDIVARIGDFHIPVDTQTTTPVRTIVSQLTPERFQSSAEVEMAVRAVWDSVAFREGRGGRQQREDRTDERPRGD